MASDSALSAVARPAAARDELDGGFDAHHGFWEPGVRLFRRLRFASKASIISLAFTLPAVALLAWLLVSQSSEARQARLNSTRQVVEVAISLLGAAHAEELAGTITREQAQAKVKSQLVKLRYDGAQYFFVFDMQPRMLVHPYKPELVGQDLTEFKDPNGIALFSEMVKLVRKDGKGVVEHQWAKPGQDTPADKISYAQGFAPWGWVIASGVYVDDLRAATVRRSAWAGGIFLAALLIPGYLFLSFYRVMDSGFRQTRRHLRALTAGDLTTAPLARGSDEAADLLHDISAMQLSLRSIVSSVRASSDSIVGASVEISSASADLSSRTEATAANVEQSAASMEQIASTVKNTADNVRQAAQLASDNSQAAARGGEVIADVVRTMEDINDSSKKIGDIIGVIDGIAFQTNILALNAAVEAARAGEQGRGFAVVASEVRSLAQRSAQAAKEIKSLISTSVGQVESGFKVAKGTGEAMQQLVSNASRMSDLLSVISSSASAQSTGVSQVGNAVSELDRMTQQNAALVEETASAAATLKTQAVGLAHQVDRFKLPAVVA